MITQSQLKEKLTYNPNTGLFTRHNSKIAGWVSKSKHTNYIMIGFSASIGKYSAHRLAFLYMTGEFPKGDVDHVDANGENNKWDNLRDVSRSVNRRNSRKPSNNTSGVTGVSWHKLSCKWEVRLLREHIGISGSFFEACCIRFSAINKIKNITERHGR